MLNRYFLEYETDVYAQMCGQNLSPSWKDPKSKAYYIQSQHLKNLWAGGLQAVPSILHVAKDHKGKRLLCQLTLEHFSEFSLIPVM